MPQTYIRAVGPGAVGRTCPVAESCSRSGSPVPGRSGISGAGHACTAAILRGRRRPLPRGQNGGQGIAGQPSTGYGSRPSCSSRSTRRRQASTSCRETSSTRVVPSAPSRSSRSASSTATSARVSDSPAQPHSTVRSLGSAWNDTPWSTPCTAPPGSTRTWPPLRSALLSTTSSTLIRRSRSSSACPRTTGSPSEPSASSTRSQLSGSAAGAMTSTSVASSSSTVSIQSWTMPGPNGPSRSTVGGTTLQPVASDTAKAATSRPARVPPGKSHRGRSPATGLYTHRPDIVPCPISQKSVALDASTSRPSTTISPCRRSSSAEPTSRSLTGPGSAAVAVGARAHVPAGIERATAERARRPPGGHHCLGPGDEGAGRGPGEPDAQQRRAVDLVVVDQRRVVLVAVVVSLGQRLGLDHDALVVGVPDQGHHTDPELLLDRRVERRGVGGLGRCDSGDVGLAGRPAYHLVEQRVDPFGEHRHL